MSLRCVVIGGGIIGACIALRVAEYGASVTLVDAAAPGTGATASSFAWVGASHPGLHEPVEYFELNAAGVAAYRRLQSEWTNISGFVRSGCLTWYTDPGVQDRTERTIEWLRHHRYSATALFASQIHTYEPAALLAPGVECIGFFADEGYVFGRMLVGQVLENVRRLGGVIISHDSVVEIAIKGDRAAGVRLASGERLAADLVISACGRGTERMAELAGTHIRLVDASQPASDAVGLLVVTTPTLGSVERVMIADDVMIRPDGGGRLIIHDYAADTKVAADTPVDPPPEIATSVLDMIRDKIDGLSDVRVESARIGIRPLPLDGLPVVGWVDKAESIYMVVTHSGVTLGPLLGELVAWEAVSGNHSPMLEAFRPSRLALPIHNRSGDGYESAP